MKFLTDAHQAWSLFRESLDPDNKIYYIMLKQKAQLIFPAFAEGEFVYMEWGWQSVFGDIVFDKRKYLRENNQ
jgi:hypothetical protein